MKLKEPENLNYADGYKMCPSCKLNKTFSEFTKSKHTKIGLASWCKKCTNAGSLARHHQLMKDPEYREKRRNKSLSDRYIYKYGITVEDKLDMLNKQNGKCEICDTEIEFSKSKVDHNHLTGAVRGILCNKCNSGLGYLENNNFLIKAKEYVERYEIKRT